MKTLILWTVLVSLAMLCRMDVPKQKRFHALNSLQSYDFTFICYSFSFVWRTGSVSDRPPLGDLATLGPRIAIMNFIIGTWIYSYDHSNIKRRNMDLS